MLNDELIESIPTPEHLPSSMSEIELLQLRLGELHPLQIHAWRRMTHAQRLSFAFQAYQFALEAVRVSERKRHPDISQTEMDWRVTRRIQHNNRLGKLENGTPRL